MREQLGCLLSGSPAAKQCFVNSQHSQFISNESLSLIDKINSICSLGRIFCSLEFFPSKKFSVEEQVTNIHSCMKRCNSLFTAVTWHLNKFESVTEIPALNLASSLATCREVGPGSVLLHLSAAGLTKKQLMIILLRAQEQSIRNLFVLRGDQTQHQKEVNDFPHAVDIVKYIKTHFESYFTICVAGYPMGHPETHSYEQDLLYLKQKVDAGADFIISQIIYSADDFIKFVKDCRNCEILVPVIPSIMPFENYNTLEYVSDLCRFKIPTEIVRDLDPIKNNSEDVRLYGKKLLKDVIQKICTSKCTPGFHFITLNRPDLVTEICAELDLFGNKVHGTSSS